MIQTGFSCAVHIHVYACIYTYTHTSKLCVWDITYLTSSNVLSHTFTKNTLKLFRTAAEGKANAKDKERHRKQSGCVWCQDCWKETAFFLSHMSVLYCYYFFMIKGPFKSHSWTDTPCQWQETAENSPSTVTNSFFSGIAFSTRKYSQFKNKAKKIGNHSVLTQSSLTSLGSIHCSSSAC